MHSFVYYCPYVSGMEVRWENITGVPLVDNVTGDPACLRSIVQMCRTDDYVHVRFECADDHIVATYGNRDDPIYKEDAVEMFIDEAGDGRMYKEFELSPRNVVFDALIRKEEDRAPQVDASWNMEGLLTRVFWPNVDSAVYEMSFPVNAFDAPPAASTIWRINWYRIDNDSAGRRHYWAWSPTGVPRNFHVPMRFGTLVFL